MVYFKPGIIQLSGHTQRREQARGFPRVIILLTAISDPV